MLQVSKFPEGTWLVFSNNWTSDLTFLTNILIPLESPFLLAEEVNTGVSLAEVYHVQLTRPLQKYQVADWNSVRGIVWFVNRQWRNLQGVTIKAAYRKQVISVVTHSFGRFTQSILEENAALRRPSLLPSPRNTVPSLSVTSTHLLRSVLRQVHGN
jgi:hypothetical protein